MNKKIVLSLVIGNILGIVAYATFIEPMLPIQRIKD